MLLCYMRRPEICFWTVALTLWKPIFTLIETQLNLILTTTKILHNLNLTSTSALNRHQSQSQPKLYLNLNSIWWWHKCNPILFLNKMPWMSRLKKVHLLHDHQQSAISSWRNILTYLNWHLVLNLNSQIMISWNVIKSIYYLHFLDLVIYWVKWNDSHSWYRSQEGYNMNFTI